MDGPPMWMDLESVHTEWSKSERERQIPYIDAYMWNVEQMAPMNLFAELK